MCPLTRRNLLVGGSGLLLFGCGDSESYTAAKDYYPVTNRYIFHWGKNSSIVIDKDATNTTYPLGGSANELSWFETGVNTWVNTLNEIGVNVSFTGSPDVKVYWLNSSQMLAKAGNPDVLGQATTEKEIYMLKGQDQTTTTAVATHEFGHMLGIWSHSFDSKDVMYPYLNSTSLSNRDKRTLVDFLYALSPDFDFHDVAGPLVHSSTGVSIQHYVSSLTTNGCQIRTSTG